MELTRRELVVLTPTPGQLMRAPPLDLFARLRSGPTVRILDDMAGVDLVARQSHHGVMLRLVAITSRECA